MPHIAPLGQRLPIECHGARSRPSEPAAARCGGAMPCTSLPLKTTTMMT